MAKKEKKKFMGTTEKVMNIWAKITSILYIILIFSILREDMKTFGVGSIIMAIILYFPLFYYAWLNKDNKGVKVWSQVLTALVTILLLLMVFFSEANIGEILLNKFLIGTIVVYVPVYYYAWRSYFH